MSKIMTMGEILVDDVRSKLELIPTVAEADVELVFDPGRTERWIRFGQAIDQRIAGQVGA